MDHRLVLLRHAKSDYPEGVPDHERPLAKRGRRDAPRVGEWLRESGFVPDLVVCSTARRARQTWELAAPAVGGSPETRYEDRIYEASALGLLMLVRELPEARGTVLLVGHNPGIGELAAGLTDSGSLSFPTAAVAVAGIEGPWRSATPGEARLLGSATPATLPLAGLSGYALRRVLRRRTGSVLNAAISAIYRADCCVEHDHDGAGARRGRPGVAWRVRARSGAGRAR